MGAMKNTYKSLVAKFKEIRQLGRPWRRWEDNIRMVLTEIGWRVRIGFMWLRIGTDCRLL
jgi:hypothetical protein